jgi:hypothetical protein
LTLLYRRYLPVLKNLPTRYIHEPWNAPEQVQRAAKCIIGKDYPTPMVDHNIVAKINQERMKQVYQHLSTYRNPKTPGNFAEYGIDNAIIKQLSRSADPGAQFTASPPVQTSSPVL